MWINKFNNDLPIKQLFGLIDLPRVHIISFHLLWCGRFSEKEKPKTYDTFLVYTYQLWWWRTYPRFMINVKVIKSKVPNFQTSNSVFWFQMKFTLMPILGSSYGRIHSFFFFFFLRESNITIYNNMKSKKERIGFQIKFTHTHTHTVFIILFVTVLSTLP